LVVVAVGVLVAGDLIGVVTVEVILGVVGVLAAIVVVFFGVVGVLAAIVVGVLDGVFGGVAVLLRGFLMSVVFDDDDDDDDEGVDADIVDVLTGVDLVVVVCGFVVGVADVVDFGLDAGIGVRGVVFFVEFADAGVEVRVVTRFGDAGGEAIKVLWLMSVFDRGSADDDDEEVAADERTLVGVTALFGDETLESLCGGLDEPFISTFLDLEGMDLLLLASSMDDGAKNRSSSSSSSGSFPF